jgi:OOP family OmpA-OmpF porin
MQILITTKNDYSGRTTMNYKKHTITAVSLACAAFAANHASAAAPQDDRWYVAPALSYIFADSDRAADDDFGLQLGLGKPVSESVNLELSLVADTLDFESGSSEFKQWGWSVDGLYFFDRSMSFSPYAVVGMGMLRTEVNNDTANNSMLNAGVGVMHSLTHSGINLRGDVRYRQDNDDRVGAVNHFGDWLLNVGLVVPFGGKSAPAAVKAAPVAAPAPVAAAAPAVVPVVVDRDSDGDGVKDSADSCPNTAQGAKVDAKGCELDSDHDGVADSRDSCPNTAHGAKVDAKGCDLDSDSDGVADSRDSCPNTAHGAKVDAKGCDLDSDSDGVADSRDSCPDSKADARVDSKGCELAEVIVLKGVNFETGSARLTADSQSVLDDMAATLTKYSTMVVEVSGHTDNTGSATINRRLSQQRADAVVSYLTGKGVKAENLKAKGYGPDKPAADNATADGRSANRRVELQILQR